MYWRKSEGRPHVDFDVGGLADELANGGAILYEWEVPQIKAIIAQQRREEVHEALQYVARQKKGGPLSTRK